LIPFLVLEVPNCVLSNPLVAFDIILHISMCWAPVSLVVFYCLLVILLMKVGPHRVFPPELSLHINIFELVLLPLTDALPHLRVQN